LNLDREEIDKLKNRLIEFVADVAIIKSDNVFSINGNYRGDKFPVGMETVEILRQLDLPEGKARSRGDNNIIYPVGGYNDKLITEDFEEDYIKELFRSLRTKIFMRLHGIVDKSLVVTSIDANVGKSTISSNIAIAIANQNWRTVLIDGDLRCGVLHSYFDVDQRPGISDFILSDEKVTEKSLNTIIKRTHVKDLNLITTGKYRRDSSDLLTSAKFIKTKKLLSGMFDMIILDTPPIGSVTDPFVVCDFFSRYIIVVRAGKTDIVDLKNKFKEFPAVKKKILGLVLNFTNMDKMRSYYRNSKYYSK
jgi:capsular exopolysaccharide synthesis family protein